ncbi:MAG: hypothetical protein M5R41_09000 [Bacteroidia bacterium]|nr:hypothetical protein [Bacteroidia bacterium]
MKLISTLVALLPLFVLSAAVSVAQPVQVPLADSLRFTVEDANGMQHTLLLGYHEAGTPGYEWELGEGAVPPVPFEMAFDFRFLDPPGVKRVPNTGAYRDIRSTAAGRIDTFVVRYQPMNEGYPLKFTWSLTDASRFIALELRTSDDKLLVADMRIRNETIVHERGTQVLHIIARH